MGWSAAPTSAAASARCASCIATAGPGCRSGATAGSRSCAGATAGARVGLSPARAGPGSRRSTTGAGAARGRGQGRSPPRGGWPGLATVHEGGGRGGGAIRVDTPATLGLERGVWYRVRQGFRGLLVPDERGSAVAYMICEPATHYYQV